MYKWYDYETIVFYMYLHTHVVPINALYTIIICQMVNIVYQIKYKVFGQNDPKDHVRYNIPLFCCTF